MFRRLAKQFAARTAQQLVTAAQQQGGESVAPVEPEVAILFAMKLEASPTWSRLESASKCRVGKLPAEAGRLGRRFCVAAVGGIGGRARRAAEQLLELRPQLVVVAGLAGALTEELKQGDVLIASSVAGPDGSVLDLPLAEPAVQRLEGAVCGRLLTTAEVVRTPDQRRQLAEQHQAVACDMESALVARICQEADLPVLVVRAISDEFDQELPADLATLLQQKSTAARLGAAAGALFKKPGRAVEFWQLRQVASQAAERLAQALETLSLGEYG